MPVDAVSIDVTNLQDAVRLILSVEAIGRLDETSVNAAFLRHVDKVSQFRPGGRSASLIALSVLLWHCSKHVRKVIDVERLLALAFRVAIDPSFVQPEWAVVVIGSLIHKYIGDLPEDSRSAVLSQCQLLLADLKERRDVLPAVTSSSAALVDACNSGFSDGLKGVIAAAFGAWPKVDSSMNFEDDDLAARVATMDHSLPGRLSSDELAMYRCYLDRQGIWATLEQSASVFS